MSNEYLLCRPASGMSPLPAFEEINEFESLGTADEVKAAIDSAFPDVQWKLLQSPIGVAWFGRKGPPEFQVMVGPGDSVTNFTMSRATREEVLRLAAAMRVAAMDLQQEIVLGG